MLENSRNFSLLGPFADRYVQLRRDIHQHPELGFEERRTAGLIAKELAHIGLQPHSGIAKTGVIAVVEGRSGHSDRSVALRADMDALPITEQNDFAHASKSTGMMHGCGHDGHVAMLLAAARILVARADDFAGRVVLIFQPGEEGHAGARAMIDDGLLSRFPIDQVFALHNWPGLDANCVALGPDRMMAGIDRFRMILHGSGGHGGHQYQTNDPIMPMVQLIQSLQSIVSKNVSALDEAVISFNLVTSGDAGALSVVPGTACIEGMTKWFDEKVGAVLEQRISAHIRGTEKMFGIGIEDAFEKLYPPTINHPAAAELVRKAAQKTVGDESVHWGITPSMGSEDFAFFLLERPGAYFRLGQGRSAAPLHSPNYDFNDNTLTTGALVHAQIALDALRPS